MIILTVDQIEVALPKVETGLNKYRWIQNNLHARNVSTDREFQRKFNGFYRVRRNSEWQKYYFALLESFKAGQITFDTALKRIYTSTGRLEASFASKLIATVNPNLPVIDRFVLDNVGLKLPYFPSLEREIKTIKVYNELAICFRDFLETEVGEFLVKRFREIYSSEDITPAKMVDLVLWQTR